MKTSVGPRQANLVLIAYASSEGSGEPAHLRSLARTSAAHTSSESRGTFRQKARSLAPLNGWACAAKICHDGMLEDTNSLDGAQFVLIYMDYCNDPKFLDRHVCANPDQITPKEQSVQGLHCLPFCLSAFFGHTIQW